MHISNADYIQAFMEQPLTSAHRAIVDQDRLLNRCYTRRFETITHHTRHHEGLTIHIESKSNTKHGIRTASLYYLKSQCHVEAISLQSLKNKCEKYHTVGVARKECGLSLCSWFLWNLVNALNER